MTGFTVTFSNVLLALLYLLPGFLLCKFRKVKAEHLSTVSVILLYVCGPGMFLNALISLDFSVELLKRMGWFLVFSLGGEIALMLLILLLLGKKRRKEFSLRMLSIACVMGNTGFFGMPVVRALFPNNPEAAVYSCVFNTSLNLIAWTVGVFTLTGEKKYVSLKAAVINPTILSVIAGLILYLFHAKNWLPQLLQDGFRTVGAMSTPLCMLILGIRLATMDLRKLVTTPVVWWTAAGKLVVFPLFCYLLVLPFPFDPVFKGCLLIIAATPCASILLNLAEIHGNGREMAANCALLTTLLSIVTIPLLSLLT